MRLVSALRGDERVVGRLLDDGDLLAFDAAEGTLASVLARRPDVRSIEALDGERIDPAGLRWLPPIPSPAKVLCVGLNFAAHTKEVDRGETDGPTLFARWGDTFVGHEQAVVRPGASRALDWEGELAVVIGRPAWHVAPEEALSYVGGYSCMAENSIRDWQEHGTQATAGKNFWRSGAFGPALVTPDEVGDPGALRLETRLNGEVVQQATTADMVLGVAEIIAYITTFTPLGPGDVVAMGTPAGVGFRRQPPRYLAPGDELEVEVERVGTLRHTVVDEAPADAAASSPPLQSV